MKTTPTSLTDKKLSLALIAFPVFLLLAGCDQQKREIEAEKDANVERLNQQIQVIEDDAERDRIQSEEKAAIDRAIIEAEKETAQAELKADKAKVEAEAEAAKARIDAGDE